MTAIIQINNLTLKQGSKNILNHFTAKIEPGEFIGVFGPNGAGKSTLLKAILGLIKPANGSLTVFGLPPNRGHPKIGYLPQTRGQINNFPLTGYAFLSAALIGHKWGLPFLNKKNANLIKEVLNLVEGESLANQSLYQLSGGEKQRLLLAQALLGTPSILLLDEPLNNLDPNYQDIIIRLVEKISHQLKVTVLFTAHDVNPLIGVMDKVLYMAAGHAAIGQVAEVITTEKLSTLYGAPMEVIRNLDRLFVINKEYGFDSTCHHCEPE